jgi:acyl-coenzyme A thioesterase PaaI-like protein
MDARRKLAGLLRDLGHELVGAEAGEADFDAVVELLEPLRDRLAERPRRISRLYRHDAEGGSTILEGAKEFSSMTGPSNPVAPPIALSQEGDAAVAEVNYGRAYEGHPGCVHGGYLAAAFDELFGLTQKLAGEGPVVTGTLTVRYRSPAPLHTPFRFEGRVKEVRGRKLVLEATCRAEGKLVADAEALFIRLEPERYEALMGGNGRREGAGS